MKQLRGVKTTNNLKTSVSAGDKGTLKEQKWHVKLLYMCMCSPVDSSVQCMLHETKHTSVILDCMVYRRWRLCTVFSCATNKVCISLTCSDCCVVLSGAPILKHFISKPL